MEVIIHQNSVESSKSTAEFIAHQIKKKPNSVLGLATGSTPLQLYQELIRLHKEEGLDFQHITTFNLDEYIGLPETHEQSYHYFMQKNLFQHINIKPENIHLPNGLTSDIPKHCSEYEQKIISKGGIDIQLLGIGSDGHIGFNEPTSSLTSRTRIKTLAEQTVKDNARFFEGEPELVPRHCITMGIGTIMEARTNLLLAYGEGKSNAIALTVEGPISSMTPASALQQHQRTKIFIDEGAASKLKLKAYYKWVYAEKPTWQHAH